MDVQSCPAPTLAETKAVASLADKTSLKYEGVLDVLAEILAFCRRPDIHGFLFTPESIQVPHFLKPNVLDSSFTGSYSSTRVEPGKKTDSLATDHTTGKFVLHPAFVSQNLSFGFAINEVVYSPSQTWEEEKGYSYGAEVRYVRDNKNRQLLSLMDAEEVGIIQFQYMRHVSMTCQFRAVACFVHKDLKAIMAKNHYDATDILRALFHMHTGLEYRACPLCMTTHGQCQCEVPTYEPKHPFDKEMALQNIRMHLGSFQGSANVAFLRNGNFSQLSSVGSRMTMTGKVDRNMAERLRSWVIRKHCFSNSPWQSRLFSKDERNQKSESPLSVADFSMEARFEELLRTLGVSSQRPESFPNPYDSHGYLSELLGLMDPSNQETSDTTSGATNRGAFTRDPHEPSIQSSIEGAQRSDVERLRKQAMGLSQQSRAATKSDSDLDEIQRMKEERRKEQNRMSARKSNQKKKAFNDALKQSLKEAHFRAAALRARELQLRKENLELRKELESP